MPPNVLLVVLDAVRRDALEPYGARSGSTPSIAQLAARGAALPSVYATSCWTVPSHASFFTGLLPRAAGLARARSAPEIKPEFDALRNRMLPEVLRLAGYDTRAGSANFWLSRISGFDAGFEEFVQLEADRHGQLDAHSLKERIRWLRAAARATTDDGAAAMRATIDGWLKDRSKRPFFWFVNLLEAHSPYLPPRPYGDVSVLDRLRAAEDSRRFYTLSGIWRTCAGEQRVPAGALGRLRRLYDGAVRYMDDWLGQVLERLDGAGVLDETLVIACSDHGENFGEGGWIAHAFSLDNRLIHVPMVMAGPVVAPGSMTSLAQLPRFLADVAGIGEHPWNDGPPEGFGVAQFDPPIDADDADAVDAAKRAGLEAALDLLTSPSTCAVAGDLKLMVRGDREELYDLAADPLELRARSPDDTGALAGRAGQVAALRRALAHPSVVARTAPGMAHRRPRAPRLRSCETSRSA